MFERHNRQKKTNAGILREFGVKRKEPSIIEDIIKKKEQKKLLRF